MLPKPSTQAHRAYAAHQLSLLLTTLSCAGMVLKHEQHTILRGKLKLQTTTMI
jgi:hypothetical protein